MTSAPAAMASTRLGGPASDRITALLVIPAIDGRHPATFVTELVQVAGLVRKSAATDHVQLAVLPVRAARQPPSAARSSAVRCSQAR